MHAVSIAVSASLSSLFLQPFALNVLMNDLIANITSLLTSVSSFISFCNFS